MQKAIFLECGLKEAFASLGISETQQSSLSTYLNLLKLKDEATYCHCLRVALYGTKVAEALELNPKALFYAGLLHDVGKVAVDKGLLAKNKNFSEVDYEKIKKHVIHGYYLLRGVHNFSAEIILRHHRYDSGGYPENLPRSKVNYSKATKELIEYYAKILAVIDFYDAAATRKNEKFKEKNVRTLLIQRFPTSEKIIDACYKRGIFGKEA